MSSDNALNAAERALNAYSIWYHGVYAAAQEAIDKLEQADDKDGPSYKAALELIDELMRVGKKARKAANGDV